MGFNKIIWSSRKADQSAVGAMNRPLRRLGRRTWETVVHVFSIIAPLQKLRAGDIFMLQYTLDMII